ncbi:hypothetical protein [Paraburkholderia gardini]|uniref:hypothetical protein n=1 Tax=Paraburkholderia gardini TaxID=2823469 RepID=UPI001E5F51F0|nr:hypothetical protein [Paraburkholderia gardini]
MTDYAAFSFKGIVSTAGRMGDDLIVLHDNPRTCIPKLAAQPVRACCCTISIFRWITMDGSGRHRLGATRNPDSGYSIR